MNVWSTDLICQQEILSFITQLWWWKMLLFFFKTAWNTVSVLWIWNIVKILFHYSMKCRVISVCLFQFCMRRCLNFVDRKCTVCFITTWNSISFLFICLFQYCMRRYLNFVNGEYSDPRTKGPPNRYARGFSKSIQVDWAKKQTKPPKTSS